LSGPEFSELDQGFAPTTINGRDERQKEITDAYRKGWDRIFGSSSSNESKENDNEQENT